MFLDGTKSALNQRTGMILAGLGILSSVFWVNCWFFCEKIGKWVIRSKKLAICSFAHFWWATWANISRLLIFGEWPKQICHGCSLLVSNLSDSLTVALLSWATWATCSHCSLKTREWVNRLFLKKLTKKCYKKHRNKILLQHFWINC